MTEARYCSGSMSGLSEMAGYITLGAVSICACILKLSALGCEVASELRFKIYTKR